MPGLGDWLGVTSPDGVGDAVSLDDPEGNAEGVPVADALLVCAELGDTESVWLGVCVAVPLGLSACVAVRLGVGATDRLCEGDGVGDGVRVAVCDDAASKQRPVGVCTNACVVVLK